MVVFLAIRDAAMATATPQQPIGVNSKYQQQHQHRLYFVPLTTLNGSRMNYYNGSHGMALGRLTV